MVDVNIKTDALELQFVAKKCSPVSQLLGFLAAFSKMIDQDLVTRLVDIDD